jgi:hypothetical protein
MRWDSHRKRLERRAVARDFAIDCTYHHNGQDYSFRATRHEGIDFEPIDDTLTVPSDATLFEVEKRCAPVPVSAIRVRGTTVQSLASDSITVVSTGTRYTVIDFKDDDTKVFYLVAPEKL